MRQAIKHLVLIDILFILLLSVSSFFEGALRTVLYAFAFIIPTALVFLLKRSTGEGFYLPKLKISRENMLLTIPTIAPTLLLIFAISALVTAMLGLVGIENGNTVDVSGNIVVVILRHALLTAILEEALFRYVPIALLSKHSARAAVVFSSVLFAFSHCNMFQIPYAIFAGFVFAVLDIVFDSIIPSFILHFLNNVISIIWMRGIDVANFKLIYVLILVACAVISAALIFMLREKYKSKISALAQDKTKMIFPAEMWVFVVMTLLISLTNV